MKKRKNDNQRRNITRNKESAVAYSSLRNNSWFFFLKLRKRSLLSCINCGVMRTFTLRAWVTCEISRNLSNSHVHGTWSRPNNPIKRRYLNRIMLWLLNSCSLLSSVILNSHLKTAVQSVCHHGAEISSVCRSFSKMMTKIIASRLLRWSTNAWLFLKEQLKAWV